MLRYELLKTSLSYSKSMDSFILSQFILMILLMKETIQNGSLTSLDEGILDRYNYKQKFAVVIHYPICYQMYIILTFK